MQNTISAIMNDVTFDTANAIETGNFILKLSTGNTLYLGVYPVPLTPRIKLIKSKYVKYGSRLTYIQDKLRNL